MHPKVGALVLFFSFSIYAEIFLLLLNSSRKKCSSPSASSQYGAYVSVCLAVVYYLHAEDFTLRGPRMKKFDSDNQARYN